MVVLHAIESRVTKTLYYMLLLDILDCFNKLFLSVTGKTNSAFLWGEKKIRTLMRGFLQFSLLDKCTLNLTDSLCLKNFIYASKMIGCSKFLWRQGGDIRSKSVCHLTLLKYFTDLYNTHTRAHLTYKKNPSRLFKFRLNQKKSVWHLSLLLKRG